MKNKYILFILINVLAYQNVIVGQQTNFELVDSLVYLSAKNIVENIKNENELNINFNSSDDYLILKSKLISHLQKFDIMLSENLENGSTLNYNIEEARINYSDVSRDGFLGTFLVKRTANLKCSYYISDNKGIGESRDFYQSISDSLIYTDISNFENIAYSFTKAEIPDEPFFSSTLEPVLAIGTAAVAVYLFFNIRSK